MEITTELKQKVTSWVEEGWSLSTIQEHLTKECGQTLTYMEVRFLVDDLDLKLKDRKEEVSSSETIEEKPMGVSGVHVTVDKIQKPGTMIGGSVTFTDGITSGWQMDTFGRVAILPKQKGHQPSPEDLREFQKALQDVLRRQGF